ncbi:MAG: glycosyltransferase family 4 protein [Candidatus Aminicenantes bacterium]|nr:glycosyltransferase family 4 protein [Candidatus Aminicenantes bacterium]
MRVLMLLSNSAGKGTYWRALQLARSLAKRGHVLTVLATSRERRLRFDTRPDVQAGVTLVEAPDMLWGPLRSGWDPWSVIARIGWARGRHFDLVHAFESRPVVIFPALFWQRCRNVRLILDWCDWFGRGGSVEERPNWLIRTLLRPVETFFEESFRDCANGTTVINSLLRRRAIELGVAPETIFHLPNGSNAEELRPIPRTEARRVLGWPVDVPIIGYIGAIFQRDAMLMAQAFDRVRLTEPRAQLLLVGYCNVAVEELVAAPDAVRCTGRIRYDETNRYLAACDICWLPMRDSGANRGRYPLKINDYIAVGRPVVATAVGDVADLVRRGAFGLLASDRPEELAYQTLVLLHDSGRQEIMGRRARQLAEAEFTWDQISGELERFYWQVLEGT